MVKQWDKNSDSGGEIQSSGLHIRRSTRTSSSLLRSGIQALGLRLCEWLPVAPSPNPSPQHFIRNRLSQHLSLQLASAIYWNRFQCPDILQEANSPLHELLLNTQSTLQIPKDGLCFLPHLQPLPPQPMLVNTQRCSIVTGELESEFDLKSRLFSSCVEGSM